MIESFIALGILFVIWAICIYQAEVNFELKIKPLHDLKRKCLVNMSKRRSFDKIAISSKNIKNNFKSKKKDKNKVNKSEEENESEDIGMLEEGNMIMQNISKAIFKFNVKLIIIFILLLVLTSVVMVYSHLEISEIVIFLIAGVSVVYLIAKFHSSKEEVKVKALESIKKKFDLSDEYIEIIKGE